MLKKDSLTIAAVQFNAHETDKRQNLDNMEKFVAAAKGKRADIISFPEICLTGYNFILYTKDKEKLLAVAEDVPGGQAFQRVRGLAKKYSLVVLFGLLEKHRNRLYNTYVAVRPDGSYHKYRKIHAWENTHMSQGDSFPIFDLFGWKCGVLVCFDNNLPENPRVYALNGCELMFAPHQTGAFDIELAGMGRIPVKLWERRKKNPRALLREFQGPKGREWLIKWLPSRAYDNNMYYVFTNGVGLDYDEVRTGNAMILDPHGCVLAESKSLESHMILAVATKAALDKTLGKVHMKTRNPHLYGDLVKKQKGRMDSRNARNTVTASSKVV